MNRRIITAPNINTDKMLDVVNKINKFVEIYAKQKEFVWVYDTYFKIIVDESHTQIFTIKRFDFEREFYHNGLALIYENNPFANTKLTMHGIMQLYMESFYPSYSAVNKFINKLLYYVPEKLTVDDFKDMNELYRNIQSEGPDTMTDYIIKNGTPNLQI